MQITKNTGRIVGFLFLLADIMAFLNRIVENAGEMKLAIGLDMLSSAIALFIAIYLYPIIKKHSQRLAVAYTGIGFLTFAIITMSNVVHWSLIALGTNYADTTASEAPHFATLAVTHYEAYYWLHFILLLGYAIGGSLLYYFLFKTNLVPKWLAIWGIIAQTIVFTGASLQLFDIPVSFYLFVQNGIFMLTFIGFLLVMGFRTEKYNDSSLFSQ